MADKKRWGVGSNQYQKRPGKPSRVDRRTDLPPSRLGAENSSQHQTCGITWDLGQVDLDAIGGNGNVERALFRFRSRFPDMIWDAARLEGNNFTLPEVRTLLDGVTVEGKKLDDQKQILALNEGFNDIEQLVKRGEFQLSKQLSDRIHLLVAVHEAIEAGNFRGEASVTGGGIVRLADGGTVEGRPTGEGGADLRASYDSLLDRLSTEPDPRVRALVYAASAIRHQLNFDGNKRTAKLMGSGELLTHGYDAISVPYARLHEQNLALDELFKTDDATGLMVLFADCARG